MSKLVFPGAGKPYRGFISEVRTWFQLISSFVTRNPAAATDINASIHALALATGYQSPLDPDEFIVTDGMTRVQGDYTVTFNVNAGVLTVSVVDAGA